MEPEILDGETVYVCRCDEIASGETGIFLLNGESLCKKLVCEKGETYLVSENPAYQPIHILESDDLKAVGRVMKKRNTEE